MSRRSNPEEWAEIHGAVDSGCEGSNANAYALVYAAVFLILSVLAVALLVS